MEVPVFLTGMKFKKKMISAAAFLLLAVLASCGSSAEKMEEPVIVEVLPDTVALERGVMRIYNFEKLRLHAYQTNDRLKNESFLIETERELIGIETPAFSSNLAEYVDYIAGLGKPLNHLIIAAHGHGGRLFAHARIYSTASVSGDLSEGGRIRAEIEKSIQTFGSGYDGDIPVISDIIQGGWITIGDVDFNVIETGEGFDIEIPALNAVYTHRLGSQTHGIFSSVAQIDETLQRMRDIQSKRIALVLTSHETPEDYFAVVEKIYYLEQTRSIAGSAANREVFITSMKRAFPGYDGENYLQMTASALFR
jgi:hypothetical protein